MSPIDWADPKDPPDEMPAFKRAPTMTFPAEMRNTPDIGYLSFDMLLDERGRRLMAARHGTVVTFERQGDLAYPDWTFSPGKRDGKGVNTSITFSILFNPASAAVQGPDATPRLLEAAVVRVPAPKRANDRNSTPIEDQVVFADLKIDDMGRVAAVNNAPPALAEKIAATAKLWRFAPARRGGQPVAAELRAPFIVVTGGPFRADGKKVPPKVIKQEEPMYPWAMRASGLRGEVVVDFVVDIEGRVRDAYVARSLNPAFDDPALEAVRKWRFEPGRDGNVPVKTHMQVPVIFQLSGARNGGDDGVNVAKKGDLSKLPEELRYDTPPRLTASVRPVYPQAALAADRTGKATVRYIVDETGHVAVASVSDASSPEFGLALLAAVEQFAYEPALKGGRPSKAVLAFSQEFNRDERFQVIAPEDLALVRLEAKNSPKIVGVDELDGKLTPISRRPPRFPLSRLKDGTPGQAVIEFLIDEEGRARLPRIASATDEAFGYAAVQSVATWRFEPPTRGGRAAIVRVKVPVNFNLEPPPPAPATGK